MEKLIVIRTLRELQKLKKYIADKEFIAFDTETTGVDKKSEIIGFSICADIEVGYYVILSEWDPIALKLAYYETMQDAKEFMQALIGRNLIMQNAPFDCAMVLNNFGVDLMPSVHTDTLILGHLLDENRSNGLKERGVELFGEDARKEQALIKDSVHKNGGMLTKSCYELYKADANLIAHYGAKDAILTLKVFYNDVPILFAQGLDAFFYDDESMPLLRGPTYDLNTSGLRVDPDKLSKLKGELEAECMQLKAFIYQEITPLVKDKYPGTGKTNVFNVGACQQRSWLLYHKLGNPFHALTKQGRELCKALNIKLPYTMLAKQRFIQEITARKDEVWQAAAINPKTKKPTRAKKVEDVWKYMTCGKESLAKLSTKYKWVEKYLEYAKSLKLLNTYVEGIQARMKYNVIRPSFLQHGTTSGRYSSRNPNFQNLPRDDKRVKSCIVARQGKIFVGADYSQLEPRVFASQSGDKRLLASFESGDDFYSVIGAETFGKYDCSMKKDAPNSFANKYPKLRTIAKVVALSATYGTTAAKMSGAIGQSIEEAQEVIDSYFFKFPNVKAMMLKAHDSAKTKGYVNNLFGRPRRMPEALEIPKKYGKTPHGELPYIARNTLNLAVNHEIQSTGASIMNRAAIKCWKACRELEKEDPAWIQVKIVMQVHDELILEGPEHLGEAMAAVLKDSMETAVTLPGVALIADPKIAYNLADLK